MEKYCVLYNPYAASGTGKASAEKLTSIMPDDKLDFVDMTEIGDYASFFSSIGADMKLVISGGDGTLNRFINDTENIDIPCSVYYFATGTGNDFLNDIGGSKGDKPFCIDRYIKDLPTVTVKGKTYRFINGVGYGIDGYCCEVGDQMRETSDKPVNYTSIAIKGLLFHYKPTNATVIVDGKEYSYKKVWIAPTMKGRFYGGGMMPTPKQDRLDAERKLSLMVFHGSGKIHTLMVFPSLFKGEHVNHEKIVAVLEGKEITVKFDQPTALQIDGETILGVTEYTARI
ncbi:MAG: diacylglycerol kinase family protein [Ruminococcaceae bacterium]|nr:diacylglycerol kinase family protein [Oscillospiraceae bacterium]